MKKTIGFTVSMLFAVSLLISACGDTTIVTPPASTKDSILTQSQSSKAASKTVVSALGTASTSGNFGSKRSKPSFTDSEGISHEGNPESIREALTNFKASLGTKRQKPLYATTLKENCAGGGTQEITTSQDDSFSGVFSGCTETYGTTTSFTDGSIDVTMTAGGGFQVRLTHFLERETNTVTNSVTESTENGTVSFTGTEIFCGPVESQESFLVDGTVTLTNLTSREKKDADGDKKFEIDESSVYTSLTIQIAEQIKGTAPDCTLTASTLRLNGSEAITDNLDAKESYTAVYDGLEIIETPTNRTVGGTTLSGNATSINGTMSITACGATATITIKTDKDTAKAPFVPDGEECPVNGQFLVTTGGVTSAIIATPTGGVKIDEGNDGTIDYEFKDCESADACV